MASFFYFILVGIGVDVLDAQLGIDDLLAGVQAIVAGKHVADGTGNGKEQDSFGTEQFHRKQDGSNGAVDHAAEQGDQADGSGKPGVETQKFTGNTAEGSANEEGGNDLATFKAASNGDGGEKDLQ